MAPFSSPPRRPTAVVAERTAQAQGDHGKLRTSLKERSRCPTSPELGEGPGLPEPLVLRDHIPRKDVGWHRLPNQEGTRLGLEQDVVGDKLGIHYACIPAHVHPLRTHRKQLAMGESAP